jgi:hypothetical protein
LCGKSPKAYRQQIGVEESDWSENIKIPSID